MFGMTLVFALLSACSGGGDDDFSPLVCAAGKTQACVCDNGDPGAQTCNKDGKAWGDCSCSPPDGTPGGQCMTDEDCTEKAAPYCIEHACAAPKIADPGEPCPHGTECAPGSFCDGQDCLICGTTAGSSCQGK